jgi:regulator of sigma E protease
MQALPLPETIALLVVILGILILAHEFGHFVTAKWFGVEAPEFGIGFPPRLLTLWRTGGWIQIQGRKIRIPRDFHLPPGLTTGLYRGENPAANPVNPASQPTMTVGSYVTYKTRHENGRLVLTDLNLVPPESADISLASPVQNLDRGTVFTLNALPIGGFVRLSGEEDPSAPNALAAKPPWQRAIILVAGVTMNFVLAFVAFTIYSTWVPQPAVVQTTQVAGVVPDTPAAAADVRAGDTILSVNGANIKNNYAAMVSQISANCDRQIQVGVARPDPRGTQTLTLRLAPRMGTEGRCMIGVRITPLLGIRIAQVAGGSIADQLGLRAGDILVRVGDFDLLPPTTTFDLNTRVEQDLATYVQDHSKVPTTVLVQAARNGEPLAPARLKIPQDIPAQEAGLGLSFHENLIQAMGDSLVQMGDVVVAVPRALGSIASGISQGTGAGEVAGPVRIGQILSVGTPSGGLPFVLNVFALLSVNLAIINLLPFPALDGGRIAFVLLEVVRRGQKVDPRKEGFVHLLGMMVLIGLIIFVFYSDIMRVLSGKPPFSP